MGLSWQQGPLAPRTVGRFLVPDPLPERMLYAEPLRRPAARSATSGSFVLFSTGVSIDGGERPV